MIATATALFSQMWIAWSPFLIPLLVVSIALVVVHFMFAD